MRFLNSNLSVSSLKLLWWWFSVDETNTNSFQIISQKKSTVLTKKKNCTKICIFVKGKKVARMILERDSYEWNLFTYFFTLQSKSGLWYFVYHQHLRIFQDDFPFDTLFYSQIQLCSRCFILCYFSEFHTVCCNRFEFRIKFK